MGHIEKKEKKCLSVYSTLDTEASTNNCKNSIFCFHFGTIIAILCATFVILILSDEENIKFSKYITTKWLDFKSSTSG